MQDAYGEYILDARDVCSNCFRRIRVDRVDAVRGDGLGHELDTRATRDVQTTTVDHHDLDPEPAHSQGTFCDCGVEGAHDRLWNPDAVSEAQFKTLLTRAAITLAQKGISLSRETLLEVAYRTWRAEDNVDDALAAGIEAAIHTEAATP